MAAGLRRRLARPGFYGEIMNGLMYPGTPFSASVSGTVTKVKDGAGQVFGYHLLNNSGVIAYAQMFNKKSSDAIVGTTVADYAIPLPANCRAPMPSITTC